MERSWYTRHAMGNGNACTSRVWVSIASAEEENVTDKTIVELFKSSGARGYGQPSRYDDVHGVVYSDPGSDSPPDYGNVLCTDSSDEFDRGYDSDPFGDYYRW